jgi:phage RecT family recombinase
MTTETQINPLKKLEMEVSAAKGMKDIVKIDVVKNRFMENYKAATGRTDALQYYEREALAFIELANNKPDIMECDPFSIMAGFARASTYGLPIGSGKLSIYPQGVKQKDGSYKQMLIVKPDAHGKKELLTRMPTIKKVDEPVLVFKDDIFSFSPKKKEVIDHQIKFPIPKASKDNVIACYCTVHLTSGPEDVLMTIDEIEAARKRSKQPDGMMWKDHYPEACKKTLYNRAYKIHYQQPDTIVLYKQWEVPETIEAESEDVTDEVVVVAAEPEPFKANVNEQTGEIYEVAEADLKKKSKKTEEEPFI